MTRIDEAMDGAGPGWSSPGVIFLPGMGFDVARHPAGFPTEHEHAAVQLTVVFSTSRAVPAAWRTETGTSRSQLLSEASVSVTPSGQPHEIQSDGADRLLMFLTPDLIATAAQDLLTGSLPVIQERYGIRDAFVLELARAARAELQAPTPPGRLYLESVATVLASYLLRRDLVTEARPTARLDPRRLARVFDFMQAHLHEDVTLRDLAEVAGLSPYHFARSFRAATGLSPHRSLVAARIERAKRLLREAPLSILEIADRVGFSDQSHFAAVFRREVGQSPREFRQTD